MDLNPELRKCILGLGLAGLVGTGWLQAERPRFSVGVAGVMGGQGGRLMGQHRGEALDSELNEVGASSGFAGRGYSLLGEASWGRFGVRGELQRLSHETTLNAPGTPVLQDLQFIPNHPRHCQTRVLSGHLMFTYALSKASRTRLDAELGIMGWELDLRVDGKAMYLRPELWMPWATAVRAEVAPRVVAPMVGLRWTTSDGADRWHLKATVGVGAWAGVRGFQVAAEARYYLFPWGGLRAFGDYRQVNRHANAFDAKGLEAAFHQASLGLGLVARF